MRSLEQATHRALSSSILGEAATSLADTTFVCVGDTIETDNEQGFLRGHGTQEIDGKLAATLCGVVERVNKLISVKPLRTRYSPEIGDVVVGRVTEIVNKKWRINLNSRQEASLQLSAVNLPGGVQRRRTVEDEANMRTFYVEGDLISAEVQSFYADGTTALHTRSTKYGKLHRGQLVRVPAVLIKRQKQHFVTLKGEGVDIILGCNGLVWVAPHVPPQDPLPPSNNDDVPPEIPLPPPTLQQMEATSRVANAIKALAELYLPIHTSSITEAFQESLAGGVALSDMLGEEFLTAVVHLEARRREAMEQ